jgi:hypothetical protein
MKIFEKYFSRITFNHGLSEFIHKYVPLKGALKKKKKKTHTTSNSLNDLISRKRWALCKIYLTVR